MRWIKKNYRRENGELGRCRARADRVFRFANVTGGVGGDEAVQAQARLAALHRFEALGRDLDAVLAAPLDVRRRVAFDAALERHLGADERHRVLRRPHNHRPHCSSNWHFKAFFQSA